MYTNKESTDIGFRNQAVTALKTVIDPELFVNIIDLGLVYAINFSSNLLEVKMTLSAPHCPLGEAITNGAQHALAEAFPDRKIRLILVWEPAWNPDMITKEGRKELFSE